MPAQIAMTCGDAGVFSKDQDISSAKGWSASFTDSSEYTKRVKLNKMLAKQSEQRFKLIYLGNNMKGKPWVPCHLKTKEIFLLHIQID